MSTALQVQMRTAMFKEGPWRPAVADAVAARVKTRALVSSRPRPTVSLPLGGLRPGFD